MNICVNNVGTYLYNIIDDYNELNKRMHFDAEDNKKFTFNSHDDFISVLTACRGIITATLKLHTYILEGEVNELEYDHTRDLYKRSGMRVTYAIIYHDLKNVFEIIDIAASDKCSSLTLSNVSEQELEDVYVAMTSFILQTMKMFSIRFGIGGVSRRGRPKSTAAP